MKFLRVAGFAFLGLALLIAVASFVAQSRISAKAKMYQVVRKNTADELFGDSKYENMGSPQVFVVRDKSIVLPGKTADGLPMIDSDKAGPTGSKYMQLKTVSFYTNYGKIGALSVALVGLRE